MTRFDNEYLVLNWRFGKVLLAVASAYDRLQQVVCMGVVCSLAMHCIQQVHRNGLGEGILIFLTIDIES